MVISARITRLEAVLTDASENVPPSLLCPGTYFAALFNKDRKSPRQWSSVYGPWSASLGTTPWGPVRSAGSQAPPQTF